jgi:hypothetical protein
VFRRCALVKHGTKVQVGEKDRVKGQVLTAANYSDIAGKAQKGEETCVRFAFTFCSEA